MDPVACIGQIRDAIEAKDEEAVDQALKSLWDWVNVPGYLPVLRGSILGILPEAEPGFKNGLSVETVTGIATTDGTLKFENTCGRWRLAQFPPGCTNHFDREMLAFVVFPADPRDLSAKG